MRTDAEAEHIELLAESTSSGSSSDYYFEDDDDVTTKAADAGLASIYHDEDISNPNDPNRSGNRRRNRRVQSRTERLLNAPFRLLRKVRRNLLGRRSRQLQNCSLFKLFFQVRSIVRSVLIWSTLAVVLFSVFTAITHPSYVNPPAHYKALESTIAASTTPGRGNPNNEKIFIASNIVRENLVRGSWSETLLELIDLIGPDNAFVSIYENDSGPGTALALQELRQKLPCKSSIVSGDHLPLDDFPTVTLRNGEKRVQRIAYLAEVRNRMLRPLDKSYGADGKTPEGFQHTDMKFDRVLFLNDIVYNAVDALHLLMSTNAEETGRASYRAACSVDFIRLGTTLYDTFVVRDIEGSQTGWIFFPWFLPRGESISRNMVLSESDAVPVKSCWSGIAAFDAKFFQTPVSTVHTKPDTGELLPPTSEKSLLKFRHVPEVFWENAECCLIHADIEYLFPQENSTSLSTDIKKDGGVYINPYVRVAYDKSAFAWIPWFQRIEQGFSSLEWILSYMTDWDQNPRRTDVPGEKVLRTIWVYDDLEHAKKEENAKSPYRGQLKGGYKQLEITAPPGGYCGQHRLFVMRDMTEETNRDGAKNWQKLPVPRF
jgi:hypothetical protein